MFTGIIQKVAPITHFEASGGAVRLRVASGWGDLEAGESIAVNGVCLTVTEFDSQGSALFFVSAETLDRTNLGRLARDSRVNLERAVTLGTRLSGHLVQGHVDGLARLHSVTPLAESFVVRFEVPKRLARYLAEKGSIALNGVSLTINALEPLPGDAIGVSITLIPHTWNHTQLSDLRPGDPVNVEVDVLAKYVENLSRPYLGSPLGGTS